MGFWVLAMGQVDVYCCVLLFVLFGPWLSDKGCENLKPNGGGGCSSGVHICLTDGQSTNPHTTPILNTLPAPSQYPPPAPPPLPAPPQACPDPAAVSVLLWLSGSPTQAVQHLAMALTPQHAPARVHTPQQGSQEQQRVSLAVAGAGRSAFSAPSLAVAGISLDVAAPPLSLGSWKLPDSAALDFILLVGVGQLSAR